MSQDKIICNKSDLTSVADAIRSKLGVTDTYYVSELSDAIERIPTGTQLPTLTNPGTSSDLLSGKELIDQNGNKVTGTIATKTSSNLTASGATVTVPAGYYTSSASKSVSTATQATPSITVNSSGLITASATQSAGYVSSGTKSATKQLTTKAAATITPGTANQTIPANTYLTGTQTIKGDANLVADNIKSGVSIFGVTGTAGGGGGGESKLLQVVERTVTEITAEDLQGATRIGDYAFHSCVNLTSVTIPDGVTYIGVNSFYSCAELESVLIPSSVTTIDNTAFCQTGLLSIEIPDSVTRLGGTVFSTCPKLKSAIIGNGVKELGTALFQSSTSLKNVIIGQAVTTIKGSAFNNCSALVDIRIPASVTNIEGNALKIGSKTNKAVIRMEPRTPPTITTRTFDTTKLDSILVHSGCLDAYKSATNWANFASYIKEGLG